LCIYSSCSLVIVGTNECVYKRELDGSSCLLDLNSELSVIIVAITITTWVEVLVVCWRVGLVVVVVVVVSIDSRW